MNPGQRQIGSFWILWRAGEPDRQKTKAGSNKLHHPSPAALVVDLLTGDSNVIELPKAC